MSSRLRQTPVTMPIDTLDILFELLTVANVKKIADHLPLLPAANTAGVALFRTIAVYTSIRRPFCREGWRGTIIESITTFEDVEPQVMP